VKIKKKKISDVRWGCKKEWLLLGDVGETREKGSVVGKRKAVG